jgi:hypothetical protein
MFTNEYPFEFSNFGNSNEIHFNTQMRTYMSKKSVSSDSYIDHIYFEVTGADFPSWSSVFWLGISTFSKANSNNFALGWRCNAPRGERSIGFHSDDGGIRDNQDQAKDSTLECKLGDTMGVFIDLKRKLCYFTRNGTLVGNNFSLNEHQYYLAIGGMHATVKVNFGSEPFRYQWEPLSTSLME